MHITYYYYQGRIKEERACYVASRVQDRIFSVSYIFAYILLIEIYYMGIHAHSPAHM